MNAHGWLPAVVCTQYPPLRAGGIVGQLPALHGCCVPFTDSARGLEKFPQFPPCTGDVVW
jgi:hypothetical protein